MSNFGTTNSNMLSYLAADRSKSLPPRAHLQVVSQPIISLTGPSSLLLVTRRRELDLLLAGLPPRKRMFTGASLLGSSSTGLSAGSRLGGSMTDAFIASAKAEMSARAALGAADASHLLVQAKAREMGRLQFGGGTSAYLREAQARGRLDQERMIQRLSHRQPMLLRTISNPFPAHPVLQEQLRLPQSSPFAQVNLAVAAPARQTSAPLSTPSPPLATSVVSERVAQVADQPTKIPCMPLACDEDPNYLSDFHCFVREELVEVFFAKEEEVAVRNISQQVFVNQVGIRCRCCSHLEASVRAPRSMAFPSSIPQIYQSFTMMLREHFSRCSGLDESLKQTFLDLKDGKTTQGVANSKDFWEHAARRLGMTDCHHGSRGIVLSEETQAAANQMTPYGCSDSTPPLAPEQQEEPVLMVWQDEKSLTSSDFLFTLLEQVQRVYLLPDECRGNRKTLNVGLPGLACQHCCKVGRGGQSRVFPVKKRTLSTKLEDLYQHLTRCTLCPSDTKVLLQSQRTGPVDLSANDQELYDLVWARLKRGPGARPKATKSAGVVPVTAQSN